MVESNERSRLTCSDKGTYTLTAKYLGSGVVVWFDKSGVAVDVSSNGITADAFDGKSCLFLRTASQVESIATTTKHNIQSEDRILASRRSLDY